MKDENDVLFGKIALELGYVTQDQVKTCVRIQEKLPDDKPIGAILLERNYITQDQLEHVIEQQRERMKEKGRMTRRLREEQLYGELVRDFDYATEKQVNECLRIQSTLQEQEEKVVPLGKILLEKGYLTEEEHRAVLDFQENNVLDCPVCSTTYNVVMYNAGAEIPCYECKEGTVTVPEETS